MKLTVYSADAANRTEKDFDIPELPEGKGTMALRQAILALQANQRLGTSSTKTRSHVHGTGSKPFKQKGLGIARQGSKVAPQMRHGAVAHGPQPKEYRQKLNDKVRRLALHRALFDRASAGEVAVIEKFTVAQPKTKLFDGVVSKIAPVGRILVVDKVWAPEVKLSARNVERVYMAEAAQVNALDLSDYKTIVVSEDGLHTILARLSPAAETTTTSA